MIIFFIDYYLLSRWAKKFITMSWQIQQSGIAQLQGFHVIYILLQSYVYLCLPTYINIQILTVKKINTILTVFFIINIP
jgi:hypothetical protein